MKSVLFVYNPQAGKGTLRGKISDVLEVFRRPDMDVTVFPTGGAGTWSDGDTKREKTWVRVHSYRDSQ